MKRKRERSKPRILWAGLCDGEIQFEHSETFGRLIVTAALFRTRREARREYEDVRKVEVREAK